MDGLVFRDDDDGVAGLRRVVAQDLRAHWAAVLALSVLLGGVGGTAIGALAGGRRTDTVVSRFLAATRSADVEVDISPDSGLDAAAVRQLRKLPFVTDSTIGAFVLMQEARGGGRYGDFDIVTIAAGDSGLGHRIAVPLLVAGRRTDPSREAEATVNEALARRKHLAVGDTFAMVGWRLEDQAALLEASEHLAPSGPETRFRITGIVRDEPDVLERRGEKRLYPSAAWWQARGAAMVHFGPGLLLTLKNGKAGVPAIERTVQRLGGSSHGVQTPDRNADVARRAVHVQAIALYLFAALAAVAGITIIAQAAARQDSDIVVRLGQLRVLGMTRRQLLVVALARPVTVAAVGTVLAVVLAAATSGMLPFGLAGSIETAPGLLLRPGLLAMGAGVVLVLVIVTSLPGSLRALRLVADSSAVVRRRPSRAAGRASALGPVAGAGVGMALDPGQGRAAIPVRSTAFGIVLGVVAVASSLTFVASLDRLRSTPARYGFPFDAMLGTADSGDVSDAALPALADSKALRGLTQVASSRLLLNGRDIPVFGVESVRGATLPTLVRGRLPTAAGELALGENDLRDMGVGIGATVGVRKEGTKSGGRLRVVGTVALPPDVNAPGGGGHGGVQTLQGLRRLDSEAPVNIFYVQLAPGRSLRDLPAGLGDPANVSLSTGGPDLANVTRVRGLPVVLAGLLAVIAFASLVHALTAGVRRRRLDLALLRVLGFTGRQLSGVLAAQATTFAVIALVIGLPAGVAAGRWGWAVVARGLGVADDAVVPLAGLAAIAIALVVAVNVVAAGPAWAARRARPATVFRGE